jgi:hypothetical protein
MFVIYSIQFLETLEDIICHVYGYFLPINYNDGGGYFFLFSLINVRISMP